MDSVNTLFNPMFGIIDKDLGRSVPSSELVPGDIYEISDPELTLLPCDSLLLSGDCIINESMLTGTNPRTLKST